MAFRDMPTATQGGGTMPAQTIKTWIARHISVRTRLEQVCVNYLLFLMVATPKHSFTQAARFAGLHKSSFCKLLKDHFFVFSSRRRHTRWTGDWSSDVCSSDLAAKEACSKALGTGIRRGVWW